MIIQIVDARTAFCRICGGSIGVGNDQFGQYVGCLMCGRSADLHPTPGMAGRQPNPVLNIPSPEGA